MRLESFIAKRYLFTGRKTRFIRIITFISIVGITIGVAALIIVLSVFNGFNSLITDILVGFDPHLRIEPTLNSQFEDYSRIDSLLLADGRVAAHSPVVSGRGMLIMRNVNRVITVRGVDPGKIGEISGVDDALVLGNIKLEPSDPGEIAGIVLGIGLADRLNAMPGDTVTIISPEGMEAAIVRFGQPILRRYIVEGIYESQNQIYDAHYAFVSLESARRLYGFTDEISGVDIRLHNFRVSDRVKRDLEKKIGTNYKINTWYDLHRDLYAVMELERWIAYIILSLIIAVAVFNILGSLTMSVIEKKRDIGVLKAMGATDMSIRKIFLFEGMFAGLIGTGLGSILGYIICLLQIHYHLFPLDPTVYIIPSLPVELRTMDFVLVGGAALLLSSLAALYPANRGSKIFPSQAIRWE